MGLRGWSLRLVTSGIGNSASLYRSGTVWVSDRMQTRVYRWRPPTCRREPDTIEIGTIRTTGAPLSSIFLMTVDHLWQGRRPFLCPAGSRSSPRQPPPDTRNSWRQLGSSSASRRADLTRVGRWRKRRRSTPAGVGSGSSGLVRQRSHPSRVRSFRTQNDQSRPPL